jgi:hypothetical protein
VDNRGNRKLDRVGKPYMRVNSITRGDGINPARPRAVRPNGITAFVCTGVKDKAVPTDG